MSYSVIPKTNVALKNSSQIGKNAVQILVQAGDYENIDGVGVDNFAVIAGDKATINAGLTANSSFKDDHYEVGFSEVATAVQNIGSSYDDDYITRSITFTPKQSGIISRVFGQINNSNGRWDFKIVKNSDSTVILQTGIFGYLSWNDLVVGEYTEIMEVGEVYTFTWTSNNGSYEIYSDNSTRSDDVALYSWTGNIPNRSNVITDIFTFKQLTSLTVSEVVADSGVLTLDGQETSLNIYSKVLLPSDSNIKVSISDGVTTIINKELGSDIDISSLTSGNLKLTFTLTKSTGLVSPKIYNYGAVATK
jgi:hypothetical protein